MATGKTENLTGDVSYSQEHQLTANDDILTISAATLSLLKPAGDLMLMQGNDTVTITDSTVTGDTGVGILLGSGDDLLNISNSTIRSRISLASGSDSVVIRGTAQSIVTLNALDPDQTSAETSEDLTTLSLGADNDTLELCATLQGTGVINFGTGSDTLKFNAGVLNNSGGIANLNNLTVTTLGGTTYRDLTLVGAGNRIEWNGNFVGSDNAKWIVIDAVEDSPLAAVTFNTANNVVSNVGFKVADRTFTQTDGGTWELSGRSNDIAFTADNSVVALYNMVLTENKTGLTGSNTQWSLTDSNISNHTARGGYLTGGSLAFNDVGFTGNATSANAFASAFASARAASASGFDSASALAGGGGLFMDNIGLSGGTVYFNQNKVSASASAYAFAFAYNYSAKATADVTADAFAGGGGLYSENSTVELTNASFDNNTVNTTVAAFATASATATATATADAHAFGGGLYAKNSTVELTNASFDNNTVNATASATAYNYTDNTTATATVDAHAFGGGLYAENSTTELTNASFNNNTAFATTTTSSYRVNVTANAFGGGLYVKNSTVNLQNTSFEKNTASAFTNANRGITVTARGGGVYLYGGENGTMTGVEFLGNQAVGFAYGRAETYGGALYAASGVLDLTSATFSGNSVQAKTSQNAVSDAAGGALYAAGMILNLTDTVFTNNQAVASGGTVNTAHGGAIYLTGASKLTYTLSDNANALLKKVVCAGNSAASGGFLYLDNSTANFVIGSNTKLQIGDSIEGSGFVSKNGADMEISAAIADTDIKWTVGSGLLELSTVARTINLNNWTIGTEAILRLSSLDDTVNMSTDKKIGTIDLGGGSDTVNTGGYTLSDGQLLVSKLTFKGGGRVKSAIAARNADEAFDITLANVILDSTITGGNGDDVISVTQASTVGGAMNLGDGDNRITGTAATVFEQSVTFGKGDDTMTLTDVTMNGALALGNGNNTLKASGTALFKDAVSGGSGKDILSFAQTTFGKTLDFGDGLNSITATGKAEFQDAVTMGKDNDTLNFSDAAFAKSLTLGGGDDVLTATGEASFLDIDTGAGDDTITLKTAGISGNLNLGDGNNTLTASGSLTCHKAVNGGSGDDTINLTGSGNISTFSGMVDLGLGVNKLNIEGSVTGNIDFLIHKGGTTTATVYRGASITGNTVSVYSQTGAELKALSLDWSDFSGDEALDKVRILISSDASFSSYEYSIELYNRVTSFTVNVEAGYFYQFQANDEDGWAQRYLSDTVAPDQVTGVAISGSRLTWNDAHDNWGGNGVKQYTVEVSAVSDFSVLKESAVVSGNQYTLRTTDSGTLYFRVKAEDYTGNAGAWSETASGELDFAAPSRPSNGKSAVQGYNVTLSWNAATDSGSGVKEYEYRIAADSAFGTILKNSTTEALSVTADNLACGTYYWQVRAIDNAGNTGEWSLSKNFTTIDTIAPTVPTNSDYSVDGSSVTVIWDGSTDDSIGSGLKGYEVQLASDAAFGNIVKTVAVTNTEAVIGGLADSLYYMRIAAVDNAGNKSGWTDVQNFVIQNPDVVPPSNPAQLNAAVHARTVTLTWDASTDDKSGVKEYVVSYSYRDSANVLQNDTATVSVNSLVLSNAADGAYSWSVQAVDNAGNTSDSVAGTGFTVSNTSTVRAQSDIDGNGVSDVMFQYTGGDYQIGFWMNGTSQWQGQGQSQPTEWELLGAYDMDGNGKAEAVMRGNVQIGNDKGAYIGYYKDGDTTQWRNISFLNNPDDIEWNLAIGNLTGNEGQNSIVWHAPGLNALGVWTDGTSNWVSISGGFDSTWKLTGTGDFNGDGKDDILFSNNGNLYTTDIESNFTSLGGWGTAWEVRAIGDFSGDGKDDLVLFHSELGSVVKFENGQASDWSSLGQLDASDWFIVGAGDYNGDKKDDLLVRQYSTGMLGYYSGGDMNQWNEMGRGVDMNWTVIA